MTGEQVREGLASRFTGLPDVHFAEDSHWVVGDKGFSEWTLSGTASSGARIEVRGSDHFEFRYEEVVRKGSHWKIVE